MSKVIRISGESCILLDLCREKLELGCKLSKIPIEISLSDSKVIEIALNNLAEELDNCWKEEKC